MELERNRALIGWYVIPGSETVTVLGDKEANADWTTLPSTRYENVFVKFLLVHSVAFCFHGSPSTTG